MYIVPEDMYPLDLYLYDAFNILGFMLPIYSSYQEQKVTEVKGILVYCQIVSHSQSYLISTTIPRI